MSLFRKKRKAIGVPMVAIPSYWLRQIATLSLMFSIGSLSLAGIMIFKVLNTPRNNDKYFAVTTDNRIIEVKMLSEKSSSDNDAAIKDWLQKAITDAYDWNFDNYKVRFPKICDKWFTKSGCEAYRAALVRFKHIEYVVDRHLLVGANAISAPIIVKQEVNLAGVYYWRLEVPVNVTYTSNTKTVASVEMFTVLIHRVSTDEKPDGIAISQFKSEKYKND